jgi:hypothetical protein
MRQIFRAMFIVFFLGSVCVSVADDPGYFLSWQQKKELVGLGRMQDSDGVWYDVWLCPGYVPPAQSAQEHFQEAGANFHEYIEADKYRSLKEGSKACFNWAFEDCGAGFIVKGISESWDRYFSVAHDRTRRRVFGWWLAYPWALMESSANMAFRSVVGSSGVAAGIACGTAVVPAFHVLDSAVEGTWNFGAGTIVLPASAMTWNTIVSPPLALIGQKPAKSRVDGFWVTMVEPDPRELSSEDIRSLGQWGRLLLKEVTPFERVQEDNDAESHEKERRIREELRNVQDEANRRHNALEEEKNARIQQLISQQKPASSVPEYSSKDVLRNREDIRRYLREQNLSDKETDEILRLLTKHSTLSAQGQPVRGKTDPLLRGAEVIGESAEDMLTH